MILIVFAMKLHALIRPPLYNKAYKQLEEEYNVIFYTRS